MEASIAEELLDEIIGQDLFQGLRPPGVKALRSFVQVAEYTPGTSFIRQDEFTDSLFVILSGLVTAYRTDESGKTEILDQLGPGSWFGEVSALSNQPSMAKLVADTPCVLAVLSSGLFKELYKGSKPFKERIDTVYRERSLAGHLKVVPLFKGLGPEELEAVTSAVELVQAGKDKLLATAGEPQERLVFVRSGAVGSYRAGADGTEAITGYLMTNSAFGDEAVLEDGASYPSTYRTLMDSELLVIETARLHEALGRDSKAMESVRNAAKLIRLEAAGEATGFYDDGTVINPDELEVMVHRQSMKGGDALVINLEKCVRCNACVESCVAVHEDGVPRLSKKGFRVEAQNNQMGAKINLATSCYSCDSPGCMMSCFFGAIRRDTAGLIRFVWDNCVGCAACTSACPYDVIRLTPPPGQEHEEPEGVAAMLANLPVVGGLFKRTPAASESEGERGYHKEMPVAGKAVKCDRCEGLPFEACVYNCPCGAIGRVAPEDLFRDIHARAQQDQPGGARS